MPWILLANWRTYALLAYIGLAAWGAIQTKRIGWLQADKQALQATFDAFKAQVKAQGEIAQQKADTQAKEDKQRAKEADDAAKKKYDNLDAQYAAYRMRQRTGNSATRSLLPAPSTGSTRNSELCYTRGQLDSEITSAVGRLRAGLADDSEPYDKAAVIAATCKAWAQSR